MNDTSKKPFISGLVESSLDPKVYQSVLQTHAKESISFLKYGNLSITNVSPSLMERVQFTECEISPFRHQEIACDTDEKPDFTRLSSFNQFSDKTLAMNDIQTVLIHAFSPDESGHRPYPSAGGLYPVEPLVFLFKDRIESNEDFDSGCYHFRPVSQQLQLIKKLETSFFIDKLMHGFMKPEHLPNFAVLYLAHIGKSIFKYRYRGYRHALMEAGAMYQQATMVSQKKGLRTTVWSTFSEQQMLEVLGLDFGTYMPLTMQFFGYGKSQ